MICRTWTWDVREYEGADTKSRGWKSGGGHDSSLDLNESVGYTASIIHGISKHYAKDA